MKQSQSLKILDYLENGHKLTAIDALELFGCNRLGARVYDLKKAGYPIQSKMIEVHNRYGEPCHVKQYWIEAE